MIGRSNGVVAAMREIVTTLRAALGLGNTESINVMSSYKVMHSIPSSPLLCPETRSNRFSLRKSPTL